MLSREGCLLFAESGHWTQSFTELRINFVGGEIIKVLESRNERILIVHRDDGAFTFRKAGRFSAGWSKPGPDLGIYDSAETAEAEARARVWWLAASS